MRVKSEEKIKKLEKIGFTSAVEKLRKDYTNSERLKELKHNQKSVSLKHLNKEQLVKKSGKFLDPTKIIHVSAQKWAVFDYFTSKYIRGYRAHDTHELSIFSKLLVFCTLNTLISKHNLDTSRLETIVTPTIIKYHKSMILKLDDIITLEHLTYLLIIEDTEEYELMIAINVGAFLLKKRKKEYYSVFDVDDRLCKTYMHEFYDYVNSYCQTMKLENIKYIEADPTKRKECNKGTVSDISILSLECCKIPLFNSIVKQPSKEIKIKSINSEGNQEIKTIEIHNKAINNPYISYLNVCRNWENTFMNSHCSVYYEGEAIQPVIVVLYGSYGGNDREKDIQQIIEWYVKNYFKEQNNETEENKSIQDGLSSRKVNLLHEKGENLTKEKSSQKIKSYRMKTDQNKYLEEVLSLKLNMKDKSAKLKPINSSRNC